MISNLTFIRFINLYLVAAVILLLPIQAFSQTAPSFTSTPVTSGLYGSTYGYIILTTDFEDDAREIDITSGPLPNGLTFTDNGDGTASISGTALEAGDFPIELRVQEIADNSFNEIQSFTISISKATLTATANNQSRAYGSTNPTLTISYTGFVNGESSSVINTPPTAVTGATITSPVAIYPITVAGGLDDNYDFDYASGMLTITKATLTATADNQSRAYGSTNPTLTISYSGFLNGDVPSDIDTGPTAATTATITSPVATYSITVAGGSDDNYDFNYVSGTLTITKATLTATADNQSRAYGSSNPTLTISYSGFVNGELSSVINSPPTPTTTATIASPVATYSITVAGGSDDNYDFNYVSGALTITKATLTVTADNLSRVYGAANPSFTVSYSGFANSENPSVINTKPTASSTATSSSPAGLYTIIVSGGLDNNYDFIYVSGTLTITKAMLTATADNKSRAYGSTNPTLTISYSGFANGDDSSDLDTAPTATTTAAITDPVATYSITVSGGSDDYYDFIYVSGTLTITKATLTITANDIFRVYGDANPSFNGTYSGEKNGETFTIDGSTSATASSAIGPYAIIPSVTGATLNNYDIVPNNGTLTITPATLTITADNKSRIYGDTNPSFSGTHTGQKNGEAFTIGGNTVATALSAIGSYVIIPSVSGGTLSNYNVVSNNGTLTITPATLTIIADDKSRAYGDPNPLFSGTYSGMKNGETFTVSGSTTALSTSPIGTYAITPSVSGVTVSNYNIVSNNGTLTITKAMLTATADNKIRIYGSSNPVFTITFSGFKNGETLSILDTAPSATTTATQTSNVGTYNIVPSGGVDSKYDFTYVNGTLTINKATLTVTADNQSRPFNSSNPVFTINYSGFVNSESPSVVDSPPTATTSAGLNSPAGTYPIVVGGGTDNNYLFSYVNGLLTITKATPVITWSTPSSITYGTALSATQLNATSSVPGNFTYTPGIGAVLNAGSNQILTANFTPTDATNYNGVTGTTVQITVNKASPDITWPNPLPITYGTALSATQLNASASVPGTFTYSPAEGTILNVGTNQLLTVNFTPTDIANYNPVNGRTVLITVNKATPVILWATPLPIKVNQPLSAAELNATASTAGTFNYTPAAGTSFSSTGNYTLSVSFTPTDLSNFNVVPNTQVQILVSDKDNPVVTWTNPTTITYGTTLSGSQLNATASVPGNFVYNPPIGTLLNAGVNQILSVSFTPSNQVNYNNVSATVQITVDKAILTATVVNASRIYGATNPALSASYSGFVNGETIAVIDTKPVATVAAIATSSVGVYPINVIGGADNNYSFSYVSGVLTITKASLIAIADNVSRAYGALNPSFTISYLGFVNGETFDELDTPPLASTAATVSSSIGTFPITVSGGVDNNYNITYTSGTLTITKATLTATAVSVSRMYGAANPAFTISYSGFVNGESSAVIDVAPAATTAATVTSSVGTYPIVAAGGTDNNYSFSYVSGVLTVTKANPVITWLNPSSITYGTALSNTQLNASSNAAGIFTYLPALGTMLAAGTNQLLSVKFTPSDQINYNTIESFNVIITINKATLTATAKNESRTYGSPNPTFTIIYSGFVNGDTESQLDGIPIGTTSATISSPVGNYTITSSGGFDNNYSIIHASGSLVIGKATLTAIAANQSRLFGTSNPPLMIIYNGFFNGDSINDIDTPPIATTTATASSVAGTYPITVAGGTDNNYNFNYVPGALTVTPNFPPSLFNFQIEITEDQTRMFTYADFGNNFSSFSGSPITILKIVSLPVNGTILWKGNIISVGQSVTVQNGLIDNLIYVPNLNYNGFDSFKWNASDGVFFAQKDAVLTIRISSVNDPPVLSNIESEPIEYSLGDPAVLITSKVLISDIDNNFIHSAKIIISENFFNGDRLSMGFGVSPYIVATFNPAIGELVLTGKESKSNYEMAITKVSFSSPVSGVAGDKKIVITVNDSTSNSNPASRIVRILEIFPEVDIVNSFTPNDDGVNDYWDFVNLKYYSKIIISVFDRNGFKVYSCFDENCKWDGKMDGKELPAGTYYYTIDLNDGKRKYQGAVTILK